MTIFSTRALGLTAVALFAAPAFGAGFNLDLEPLIGYERVQKFVPTAHTTDRMVYGARMTAGLPLLALEAQYTKAKDTETFTDLTVTDDTQKAKVGVRAGIQMGGLLRLTVRGGVQAKQNIHTETPDGGTASRETEPIAYDPYAGGGLRIALGSKIAFTAEVVAVFADWPDMNKNEYETTAGLTIAFGNAR